MALANLSIHYTWKNIKPTYSNDKFKIWNYEFDLPDILDILYYFEYII